MRFQISTAVAMLIFLLAQPATAEVLLIDSIHQAPMNSAEGVPRPHRGMTMDQVRQRYGAPDIEYPWVGEPPITRWEYAGYSVFFEYQHVLTSVVHR
jgi:hypothetical protein